LCLDVRREVIRDEIIISVLDDTVEQCREGLRVTKGARRDGIEDGSELGLKLVVVVQMAVAKILNILREVTEEEDVLFANLASDFNLG
jgi:hypothetical protein